MLSWGLYWCHLKASLNFWGKNEFWNLLCHSPDEKAWYLQMEASTWNHSKIWTTMAVRLYSQQRSKTSVLAADQRQFRSRTCLAVSSATWLGSVGFAVSCQRLVSRFGNWMNWMDFLPACLKFCSGISTFKSPLTHSYKPLTSDRVSLARQIRCWQPKLVPFKTGSANTQSQASTAAGHISASKSTVAFFFHFSIFFMHDSWFIIYVIFVSFIQLNQSFMIPHFQPSPPACCFWKDLRGKLKSLEFWPLVPYMFHTLSYFRTPMLLSHRSNPSTCLTAAAKGRQVIHDTINGKPHFRKKTCLHRK